MAVTELSDSVEASVDTAERCWQAASLDSLERSRIGRKMQTDITGAIDRAVDYERQFIRHFSSLPHNPQVRYPMRRLAYWRLVEIVAALRLRAFRTSWPTTESQLAEIKDLEDLLRLMKAKLDRECYLALQDRRRGGY